VYLHVLTVIVICYARSKVVNSLQCCLYLGPNLRTRKPAITNASRVRQCSRFDTSRSFRYASPYLWNQLSSSFRQPHSVHCPPGSPHSVHITSSQSPPSLSSPMPLHFTPDLKLVSFTNPFLHSHSYSLQFTDIEPVRSLTKWALAFVCFSFVC